VADDIRIPAQNTRDRQGKGWQPVSQIDKGDALALLDAILAVQRQEFLQQPQSTLYWRVLKKNLQRRTTSLPTQPFELVADHIDLVCQGKARKGHASVS
jgi:hypothetical protein